MFIPSIFSSIRRTFPYKSESDEKNKMNLCSFECSQPQPKSLHTRIHSVQHICHSLGLSTKVLIGVHLGILYLQLRKPLRLLSNSGWQVVAEVIEKNCGLSLPLVCYLLKYPE